MDLIIFADLVILNMLLLIGKQPVKDKGHHRKVYMFEWFKKKAATELRNGATIVLNPSYKEEERKTKMTHYEMVKEFQSQLGWVFDKAIDEIQAVPKENHMMHATNWDKKAKKSIDICTLVRNGVACGKPHADPIHNLSGKFELDDSDWELLSELDDWVEELQKKICEKHGHNVTDDQCCIPEHRYCINCRESTPNVECNY